jgi:hypothetical protein
MRFRVAVKQILDQHLGVLAQRSPADRNAIAGGVLQDRPFF